ncbi:MAG: hypothetical protein CV087_08765 [Candidatus Brocadia sp. WS118]|nr:MAG: hypothetical protein CV087_08765 [Candidatus Brocadia sp. WS118]
MVDSTISSGNVVTNFMAEFAREYVRESRFSKYTGKTANSIIHIKEGLQTISLPLISKLSGSGVSGNSTLSGNEENLNNYSKTLTPTHYRHAVTISDEENEKSEFDLYNEAREFLMLWAKEKQRDDIIQALGAIYDGTTYANYGSATAGAMDTWLTNNSDRVLYGASKSNQSAGNHTTSLSNVDTTNDRLTPQMISLAKRMAKNCSPLIRPIKTTEDKDFFVMFVDSYGMRDLRENSTMAQANREAWTRGESNPLFTGGDLIWDNVVIREIEEISTMIDGSTGSNGVWGGSSTADSLATGGANSSRVGVGFLCGAQAIGYGLGKMPRIVRKKEDDYEFNKGVGITLKHDIDKMYFNNKQHGMVTVFYSAPTDA